MTLVKKSSKNKASEIAWDALRCLMVEVAGIEPASEMIFPPDLHV